METVGCLYINSGSRCQSSGWKAHLPAYTHACVSSLTAHNTARTLLPAFSHLGWTCQSSSGLPFPPPPGLSWAELWVVWSGLGGRGLGMGGWEGSVIMPSLQAEEASAWFYSQRHMQQMPPSMPWHATHHNDLISDWTYILCIYNTRDALILNAWPGGLHPMDWTGMLSSFATALQRTSLKSIAPSWSLCLTGICGCTPYISILG